MRAKTSNRYRSLGKIASKLGEAKSLTNAGAFFLLAMAHEAAKARSFEPLNEVQQLLVGRKSPALSQNEEAQALEEGFDDLLSAWTNTVPDAANLDEAFEAMTRMSASEVQVVLAQSGINRAPVSDAAVDYIDPTSFTAMKEADSLQSVPAPVAATAPVADEGALALKLDPELALDPNALAATSAGPLLLPVPLLLGAGAVALAGGGGVGGSGAGAGGGGAGAVPVNDLNGRVIDGYIKGATVTVKQTADNKVVYTAPVSTDVNGAYVIPEKFAYIKGTYFEATGGDILAINSANKLATNFTVFKAPFGSTVISPLTTLVQAYMDKNGVDVATAKDAVTKSLGLDGKAVDLTTYDPLAVLATKPTDATALLVEKKMAMLGQLANDAAQNPDTGLSAQTATAKLFDNMAGVVKGGSLDLTNVSTLDTVTLHVINPAKLLTSELQFKIKGLNDAGNVTDLANSQTQAANNLKATINFTTGNDQGAANEDGKLTASGEFTVADPDSGQNKVQTQTATAGVYGNFSLNDAGAGKSTWSYQLNNASGIVQSLRAGDMVTDKFMVTSFDGSAQQLVTITISGTNDNPTVSAALTNAQTEATGKFDVNLLAGATDADAGETATLSVVDNSLTYKVDNALASTNVPGGLSHAALSNVLNIDTNAQAFDYLAAGEKTKVLVSYQIKDAQSVVVQQTATVIVSGTNDAPLMSLQKDDVASANLVEPAIATSLKTSGTLTLRDVDTSDKVNVEVSSVKLGGTVGTLSEDVIKAMFTLGGNANNEASVTTANNLTWSFDSGSQAFKFLGQDQTLTLTYTLKATDTSSSPLSSTQDVTITIKGMNDAPVINSVTPVASAERTITELSNTTGSTTLRTLEGVISITDPDMYTDLSKLIITATPDGHKDFPGSFSIDKPDAAGNAVWHYAIQDKYLDSLKGSLGGSPPDSHTLDHVFVVNDGSGTANATASGHVYVTLLGADGQ